MAKKLLFISFLLSILSVAAFAKGETMSIKLGSSKTIAGGKISIRFLAVSEDSRCPMNARCVWAGNAKIKVAVSVGRRRAEIVELNSNLKPQAVTIYGYRLSLQDLNPQKGQPADWPKGPVKATISVEKV